MAASDKNEKFSRFARIGAPFAVVAASLSSLLSRGEVSPADESLDWMGIYATTAVGGLMAGVDTGLVCGGIYWLLWRLQRNCA
ncbi:MAG: hypothetical protein K2W95_25010 [Candidatus Obscuribacterales bacterium]|nr:hypothetical protein [Candidatus Obscuribacterales bacterium]